MVCWKRPQSNIGNETSFPKQENLLNPTMKNLKKYTHNKINIRWKTQLHIIIKIITEVEVTWSRT